MFALDNLSISNLPAIKVDGVYRVLACIPSSPESVESFPLFSSIKGFGALSPSKWKEIDLGWYNPPINDQGMTSSCVSQTCAKGMEFGWLQSGRPSIHFNPYFNYGLINGGRDQGAMISDGLRALMRYGICTMDALPSGRMFKNQFPQSAFENAKRFRLAQAYKCNNFEEICSAITLGFVAPLGILVDENFSRLDNQGVSGVPNGNRGGGHAILGIGLKKSRTYGWIIKIRNSWGKRWGMGNGCSYIHKGHFRYMNPDAWAIQSILDDPKDNTPADEVPVVRTR